MKREELFRTKEYWIVQIQNDLYGIIEGFMKKNGLSRTKLAEKLNVTKGYVTQVLNGDFDHKVSKLVELALASGKAPILHFVDLDQYIQDDKDKKKHVYNPEFKPVIYFTNVVDKGTPPNEFMFQNESSRSMEVEYNN
jgi:transcriptional regulator with XRE-family HTH domain